MLSLGWRNTDGLAAQRPFLPLGEGDKGRSLKTDLVGSWPGPPLSAPKPPVPLPCLGLQLYHSVNRLPETQ